MYLQTIFAEPMMIEAEEPTRSRRTSFMSEGDMNDRGGDAIDGAFKRAMKKVYSVSNFIFETLKVLAPNLSLKRFSFRTFYL